MASQDKVVFEIIATAKGVKVVQQQVDKLAKSTDRADTSTKKLTKTRDNYNRREKGAAQISSNTTKNFSKMQQGIDGGGGSGGLVRAYALLAANVFALTAAFGVLSRSAQIDTLVSSMEILSSTGGTYIKNLAKEMQSASGFAVDLAQSFSQVSLASSAGLNTKEIEGLTKVAKGAAISLGRNLPDAMDRIFRGAIKLEPEILDEIGLFIRVDEAAQKYARNNNKVVSSLTQVEKRQAFLNEILEQGTRKFSEYAEEITPDPYVRLGAALGDIAQNGISMVNSVLGPLLGFLAESKTLLTAVFGLLVATLLKKAIPAMGLMTKGAAELATEQAAAAKEYSEGISQNAKQAIKAEDEILTKRRKSLKEQSKNQKRFTSRGKSDTGTKALDKAKLGSDNRRLKVEERITSLKKSQRDIDNKNQRMIKSELASLNEELRIEKELSVLRSSTGVKPGELADRRQNKLDSKARVSTVVAGSAGTMETQGISAGWSELNKQLEIGEKQADGTFKAFTRGEKATAKLKGGVSALGVGFNKLMMIMGPAMMILGLLSPLLIMATRAMGFGREEAKAYSEELKKASDRSENLSERIKAQTATINNLEASYSQQQKAQIAFNKTMLETMETIDSLEESFRRMSETGTGWTRFVDKFVKGTILIEKIDGKRFVTGSELDFYEQQFTNFFNNVEQAARGSNEFVRDAYSNIDGAKEYMDIIAEQVVVEAALVQSRKESNDALLEGELSYGKINSVTDIARGLQHKTRDQVNKSTKAYNNLDPILQRQVDILIQLAAKEKEAAEAKKNLTKETGSYKQAIANTAPVLEKETEIIQNLDSAMKGAAESVGKFQAKFMPKTDVDDILSSFKQMSSGFQEILDDPNISDSKVDDFFNKFADSDNPFNALFAGLFETVDGKKVLKDSETARELFFDSIGDFERYQAVILESKTQLKSLGDQQKIFSKFTSAGLIANIKHQKTFTDIAKVNFKVAKETANTQLKSFGLNKTDDALMRNKLANAKTLEERNAILLEFSQDENKIRAANAFFMNEEDKHLEYKIQQATEGLRIQKETVTEQIKQAALQKELAIATDTLALNSAKLNQRSKTGSLTMTASDTAKAEVKAAATKLEFFLMEAELKRTLLNIEHDLLIMRIRVLKEEGKIGGGEAHRMSKSLTKSNSTQNKLMSKQIAVATSQFRISLSQTITKAFGSGAMVEGIKAGQAAVEAELKMFDERRSAAIDKAGKEALQKTGSISAMFSARNSAGKDFDKDNSREDISNDAGMQMMRESALQMASTLEALGPEGAAVGAVVRGALVMTDAYANVGAVFEANGSKMEQNAAIASAVASSIGAVSSIMAANSKQQIAEVDGQIEAEKKRDGKSKESLAKIAQMEKKKEGLAKKAFDQNKKMQMASVIANTAASIMQVMSNPSDVTKAWGIPMSIMIGAMGAAQLAIISKTKYNGGGGSVEAPKTAMSLGSRQNTVDVAQGANSGELSYMRGARGSGSGANDFAPGAAMGRKGYAAGGEGILVGERGPEVIMPSQKVDVIPNDRLGGSSNVNFSINAVDAAGVEDLLVNQRGNIIRMIREAANDTGERFLETVDTQAYGSST